MAQQQHPIDKDAQHHKEMEKKRRLGKTDEVHPESGAMADINITPLIDVMLVLLIMLIVTLPPTRHAIKLDTPLPNKEQTPPPPPEIIRIRIDYDGSLSWNGSPIGVEELDIQLAAQSREVYAANYSAGEPGPPKKSWWKFW